MVMPEDDAGIVARLRFNIPYAAPLSLLAADRIEAQAAEIKRLREDIAGPAAWLDSWAQHVGNCQGGYVCTCGLVVARSELSAALERGEVSE